MSNQVKMHAGLRARLLASTAVVLCATASSAGAIDVLYDGATPDGTGYVAGQYIWAIPAAGESVIVNVNDTDLTSLISTVVVTGNTGSTNITVGAGRTLDAGLEGVWTYATTGNTVVDTSLATIIADLDGIAHSAGGYAAGSTTGTIDITAGNITAGGVGVFSSTFSGETTIDTTAGTVTAVSHGIAANIGLGGTGSITVDSGKIVSTAGNGIWLPQYGAGDVTVTTTDTIDAAVEGIWTAAVGGNTTIDATGGKITAGGDGIAHSWGGYAAGNTGAGTLDIKTGDVDAGWVGVFGYTLTGNNTIDTTAGTVDAGTNGVAAWVFAGTGAVDLKTADVNAAGIGVWSKAYDGDTTVDTTAGKVTAYDGIVHATAGYGIGSNLGNVEITAGDVTATNYGIFSYGYLGDNVVNVTAGSLVTANNIGVQAATWTGDTTLNVETGATVEGLTYGVVTGTTTGTATTNNLGIIQDKADDGLTDTTSGDAYWNYLGNGVLNNDAGGVINGRVHSNGSTTFKFNNNAGSTWNAGTGVNALGAPGDEINNAGLINIRNGLTGLTALDNLNNEAGGVIDMQYGEDADDIVNGILSFNPKAGSKLKFDVDFAAASDGDDHSSYGAGKGDTIYTLAAAPVGVSLVNINALNKTTQGSLVATSGSIALVNSGGSNLADPGLGGLATMIASDNYTFENDPTTGAVKFMLVEDGNGGVYLQWAPNITAESLGAYVGGSMSNPDSVGGAINGAMGGLAGVGAGFGGGPGGGGVAGNIADAAALSAAQNGTCGPSKDMLHGTYSTDSHVWMSAEGQGSEYDGGGSGWNGGTSLGIERDIGGNMGLGCGDVAVGMFGFIDAYSNSNASGMQEGNSKGGGLYAKTASQNGLYASVLGAVGFGDADLTNSVFGSTAQQDSMNYIGNISVGYTTKVSDSVTMDMRVFGTVGHVDGDGFTDSAGIVVDGTKATSLTVGAMIGLSADIADNTSAFVNVGAKYITLSQEATAFGTTVSGTTDTVVGAIEAGIVATITESATFSVTGFGDVSTDAVSYGGNLTLNFKL